jgi:MoxR-like ATPase
MTAAQIGNEVTALQEKFNAPKAEVGKVVVGQDNMIHRLLLGLLAGGHVLIEGVPGLAKTLAISTLADTLDVKFSRIQFTPDMLPGDITGTQIFNPKEGTYSIKRGPVFGNLVLADEINRAPAKVQAALLQAMQEGQVTLGDETMDLEEPFLVMATQNPIEQEGTYPLPEAQLDRFMLKVKITYPSKEDEIKVLDRMAGATAVPKASTVMTPKEILDARAVVRQIFVDDKVKRYVVELVAATRDPVAAGMTDLQNLIENGASVRASISLIKVAKANALLEGRSYISPHDVKTIAKDVLRHRILVTYEAEAEGKNSDDIIDVILDNVQVP